MRQSLFRPRTGKCEKAIALGILLGVELVLACIFWFQSKPTAIKGYVVKNGDEYMVLWVNKERELVATTRPSLEEALSFAKDDLSLTEGSNAEFEVPMEHLWLRADVGRTTLYWKTMNVAHLQRLTFRSSIEAHQFYEAFRRGAYSPSPYGHAISLMPVRAE